MLLICTEISTSVPLVEFLFSGIGGTVLCSIITLILGGFIGFRIGVKSILKQTQKAGNNNNQSQIGTVTTDISENNAQPINCVVNQSQKAKDNANQIQIGGIHHGKR